MVLSEAEAEARLVALHRERAVLDRAIADLTLYLELGRRLTAMPGAAVPGTPAGTLPTIPTDAPPGGLASRPSATPFPAAVPGAVGGPVAAAPAAGPAVVPGDLSEGALARRHGRALIDAALAVLDEAGRPLHASEILAVLAGRGFAVPGHDPVAALNTRLWKRSGPDGPLRRLGDAVYVRAVGAGEGVGRDRSEDDDA